MGDEVAHKVANATGWEAEGAHTHSGGPVPAHHVSTKEPKGAALLPAFCSAIWSFTTHTAMHARSVGAHAENASASPLRGSYW